MPVHRRTFMKRLGLGTVGLGVAAAFPMRPRAGPAPVRKHLPRGVPEAQGISSAAILDFVAAAGDARCGLHGLMMLRHGHVVAEGWWQPYRPDAIHSLYSLSKSFTSTAVGFAVAEGKLKLDDRVVHFFPAKVPSIVSDNLAALNIRHLLTMSVGHAADSTFRVAFDPREGDWVRNFLSLPIENPPGSVFLYDTAATYMLSAIVQKVTGLKLIDYLRPRLFDPLEIHGMTWATCPLGINTGGWGLSVTTEALAKFGLLYLQKGRWNGGQLMPAAWIEEATAYQIQQPPTWDSGSDPAAHMDRAAALADPMAALAMLKQTSDWYQGYGYQFWRCRHQAFRGDGAFGQFCIVIPDQDAVIAITAETADSQGILNLVWKYILPALHDEALPADANTNAHLKKELASLALPLPSGTPRSPTVDRISGRNFHLDANNLGVKNASLLFRGDSCAFTLGGPAGEHVVHCGLGGWLDGSTTLPGVPPKLFPGNEGNTRSIKVAAAGAWKDQGTFEMQWRFYETPHLDTVTCRFDGGRVRIEFMNSITQVMRLAHAVHPETRPILEGRAAR